MALLGTALSPAHETWLVPAPALLLLLDGDLAGRTAARTIAAKLSPQTRVRVHDLPRGYDPDDISDHDLRTLVRRGLPSP